MSSSEMSGLDCCLRKIILAAVQRLDWSGAKLEIETVGRTK